MQIWYYFCPLRNGNNFEGLKILFRSGEPIFPDSYLSGNKNMIFRMARRRIISFSCLIYAMVPFFVPSATLL